LSEGLLECDKVMAHAFSKWHGERTDLVSCHNTNISLCAETDTTDHFDVAIYNPRTKRRKAFAFVLQPWSFS
jgi:hypothetical protein